jgi:serine/threonine-protein kinase
MSLPSALTVALDGRYELLRELGAGGMATVYLARDVRHERSVALKVMHAQTGASVSGERFLREIRIAAGLQHPHIVPLLDSGALGDQWFYAMPYIEGETLRQLIARGPLSVERAVQVTREISDALAAAHRAGIVHRDLKPEKVLLSHGHALVADFGVARTSGTTRTAATRLTEIGLAIGTPTYMAPEQAFGDESVDARADVYALGVLLFELLTGAPPLVGTTPQATVARRLTELPPQLARIRSDIPEWLDTLVASMLAREPGDRPVDAGAVLAALGAQMAVAIPTPAGGLRRELPSVVVLPFANTSADPENEFFSDGIAEELISALAQEPALRVIARTSAFAFKGKPVDVRTIAQELGVHHVVEGSVRRAGTQLRVTAQLIDAHTGSPQWSGRYDRTLLDVFAIQDEISSAVRDAVVGKLTQDTSTVPGGYQTDPDTYDLFLRGRYLLYKSVARYPEAAAAIAKAAERDPRYVPAAAAQIEQLSFGAMMAQLSGPDTWPTVQRGLEVLEAMAPQSIEWRRLRAIYRLGALRDHAGGIADLRQTLEAAPSDAMAHGLLSLLLMTQGDQDQGRWHARRSVALDPLSAFISAFASNNLAFTTSVEEALLFADRAIELDPGYPEGHHMRGYTMLYLGRYEEAHAAVTRAQELGNHGGWPIAKRAVASCGLGRYDEVVAAYRQLVDAPTYHDRAADSIACVLQLLGRNDEAFQWLERAMTAKASWTGFIGVDPLFALLARDPRFGPFCDAHRITRRPLAPSAFDTLEPCVAP